MSEQQPLLRPVQARRSGCGDDDVGLRHGKIELCAQWRIYRNWSTDPSSRHI